MQESIMEQCQKVLGRNGLSPIRRLGKGAFGIVYLVSQGSSMQQLYSVKCTYKKQFSKKPVLRKYLRQEIQLMQALDHPGIVKLHRTFEDDGWIFMLMEYCDQGNLTMVQTLKKDLIFSYDEFLQVFLEIIEGLQYLHNHNIIHRDIKPENILRTSVKGSSTKAQTKICDFGFSREIEDQVSTVCGTTYFMAPEIFGKKKYDKTIDIWAVGVLAYSMLFGAVPFKSVNMELDILNKCQTGFNLSDKKLKHHPSIGKPEMKVLGDLFSGIFQIDPEQRMSLDKIKQTLGSRLEIPQLVRDKSNQTLKKSIETDISEQEDQGRASFQLEEVNFIQSTWREIRDEKFLSPLELSLLKYELDKVCISILSCGRTPAQISEKQNRKVNELKESQALELSLFKDKLKQIQIPKLQEVFKVKSTITFQEYKEEYRLVVGHAFSRAQKKIKSYNNKMRIKLKLLCCHTINRVLEKEYLRDLFRHFLSWQQGQGKPARMDMRDLQEWMGIENSGKIIETIDLINTRFYGKTA